MLRAGETFYCPAPGSDRDHFFVTLTDADEDGRAAIVPVVYFEKTADGTVLCGPNDHQALKKPSAVFYAAAAIVDIVALDEERRKGTVRARLGDDCSPSLLERMQDGIVKSPDARSDVREFCVARWGART